LKRKEKRVMEHGDCQFQRMEEEFPVKELRAPAPSSMNFDRVIAIVNTLLLVALVSIAGAMYFDVTTRFNRLESAVGDVAGGQPSPVAIKYASKLMSDAASDFFFGAADGEIAGYLINLLTYDFGTLATNVVATSNAVSAGFATLPANDPRCNVPGPVCTAVNNGNYLNCPNGNNGMYCYPGAYGQQLKCSSVPCVGPSTVTGANLVASVAGQVATWKPIAVPPGLPPAAFSDGPWRFDVIVQWLQSQTDIQSWSTLGGVGTTFVNQMNAINWQGTYLDNGQVTSWDAVHGVGQPMRFFGQIFDALAAMTTSQKKQQK